MTGSLEVMAEPAVETDPALFDEEPVVQPAPTPPPEPLDGQDDPA